MSGGQTFNLERVMTPSFHDEKHKQLLRKIEKNKKEEYEVKHMRDCSHSFTVIYDERDLPEVTVFN